MIGGVVWCCEASQDPKATGRSGGALEMESNTLSASLLEKPRRSDKTKFILRLLRPTALLSFCLLGMPCFHMQLRLRRSIFFFGRGLDGWGSPKKCRRRSADDSLGSPPVMFLDLQPPASPPMARMDQSTARHGTGGWMVVISSSV